MPIRKLEHYNLVTTRLDETIAFYGEVLGMRHGPAPGLDDDAGAWIYDQTDTPVVHIVSAAPHHLQAMPPFTRERSAAAHRNTIAKTGVIDHIAFDCTNYHDLADRLRDAAIPIVENVVAAVNLRQIFVDDPNGVTLELNFRSSSEI